MKSCAVSVINRAIWIIIISFLLVSVGLNWRNMTGQKAGDRSTMGKVVYNAALAGRCCTNVRAEASSLGHWTAPATALRHGLHHIADSGENI